VIRGASPIDDFEGQGVGAIATDALKPAGAGDAHADAGRNTPTAGTRSALALVLVVLVVGLLGVTSRRADAHTPHDVVADVVASPSYAEDGKIWAISGNWLLVSKNDGRSWKPMVRGLPNMPQDGKTLAAMAISASDPRVMFVSSAVGGVFRSRDGGASWHRAAGGLTNPDITPISVSPSSADVVLAGGSLSGLFRTTDGGDRWNAVPGFGRVRALAFVPGTGRAVVGDSTGRVSISDDEGASWRVAARAPGGSIVSLATSSEAAGGIVFAGTEDGGLLRSEDGAGTFTPIGTGLPNDPIESIALSPTFSDDQMMWVSATSRGVYRSVDAGETWTRAARGLTTDPQAALLNNRDFRTVAVARDASGHRVLFEAGFDGLFRSRDDGRRWREVETLVDFVVGIDVSPDFEQDSTVAVTTYVKGAYLSTDKGRTWESINTGLDEPTQANSFAPVRRLHNVVFSPDFAKDDTIFSATWPNFIRSTNGGRSWSTIDVVPPSPQLVLRQFVIAVSPRHAADRTIYLGTRQGEIYRSARAGEAGSWTLVGNAGSRVRSLAIDAVSPERFVLYAGTVNGVVTSTDGGATWVRTGPPGIAMLAMSPDYATDGTVFAGTEAGLFVTRNKGLSWNELTDASLARSSWIEAVAVSPAYRHDRTLLVSVGGEGLYRSSDGGASFDEVGSELIETNHVIGDFSNPTSAPIQFSPSFSRDRTIFGYAGQDVVRSTDGGDSWAVLKLPSAATFLRTLDSSDQGDDDPAENLVVVGAVLGVAFVLVGVCLYAYRRRSRA
jgi:photosystem II stability/assembly factor-like uncharacterized protein